MALRITEVKNTKKEYEEIFKLEKPVIPAILCDVNGLIVDSDGNSVDAKLASNPNYVWVRSYAEATPQPVLNMNTVPPVTGTPVYIGWPEGAQEVQILGINKEALSEEDLVQILTGHHEQHEPGGFDPLYLYRRAFAFLRTYASNALYNGLEITITSLEYDDENGERAFYPGESGFDLSAYLPAAGNKKWILIYLDITTNTIKVAEGTEVLNVAPINAIKPNTPTKGIASAYIILTSVLTDVTESEIEDARRFLNYPDPLPLTTKGDLLTYTTELVRLGVGADGTVLTVDSAQPTGLKWSVPAGGNVWPKAGEANISDTAYATIELGLAALAGNDQLIIGEGSYTTNWGAGGGRIPTTSDVLGSGIDVTNIANTAAVGVTLEIEGDSLLEAVGITNNVASGYGLAFDNGATGRAHRVKSTVTATGTIVAYFVFSSANCK